ncbi:hypothetical protein [Gloeothece verrucosa]|uniref:Uncharacterized protein n=1 Tax=Gloeothece verrucosa (strain PCC 7822) TaxID=497965 RepID=E0UDA1_GLOV7|nr:hypothetical protein [Gloeothece verrucosa]ADN14092.1 hypothetical protein Cyan7822_2112 [Gloeothece verrucosa PCC 7822]
MDPLSIATISIISAVATKVLENAGEKVGETLYDKTSKFLASLKKQSPDTVTAIEKAPQQPLDYGTAILEIESAAKANPDVAKSMAELAQAARTESNPQLQQQIQEILNSLKSAKSSQNTINCEKLADDLKNFFQNPIFNAPVTFN